MNTHFAKNVALIGAMLAAQLAGAEVVDKRTEADPKGEVEISNVSGSVRVTGWDKAEVQVHADLGAGVERLDFERKGDHTLIKVVLPRGNVRDGDADLTIQVPQDSRLRINTVSADQLVAGVRGTQSLQSVSGDIESQVFGADFTARNVSGEITARGQSKTHAPGTRTRVNSVSGEIVVQNTSSEYELETVSGSIELTGELTTRAELQSTNGELNFIGSLARDTRFEAETINGEITLRLQGELNASFEVETFNGSIDNCFGPKAQRTSEYGPGKELRFDQGDRQGRVHLQTLNGGINLCNK